MREAPHVAAWRALILLATIGGAAQSLTDAQLEGLGFSSGPPQVLDVCADDNHFCEEWALHGECERNPRYMLAACQRSCTRCLPEDPTDTLGKAADPHVLSLMLKHGKVSTASGGTPPPPLPLQLALLSLLAFAHFTVSLPHPAPPLIFVCCAAQLLPWKQPHPQASEAF
mmetsp:Transcript_5443/g.15143  ORF Transcript_5443/g.15143 Transcript_5443/m.15143 type:complete len:170 (-) Transcript_5443:1541-2050(-)